MNGVGVRGIGNSSVVTEFQDGRVNVSLEIPLTYADKNQKLSNAELRKNVLDFEDRYKLAKIEHSMLIADDGEIWEKNTGDEYTCEASELSREFADVLTHNHPSEEGWIGGTFSDLDIANFINYNQHMYRAVAKEGTYVISKGDNFTLEKGRKFRKNYKQYANNRFKYYDRLVINAKSKKTREQNKIRNNTSLSAEQKEKKIQALENQYNKRHAQINNTFLTDLHNYISERASDYGFIYGLERRR